MKKDLSKINPFTEEFDETSCIEYYVGVEGSTIDRITCPEHVYEVLDRMHSMALELPEYESIFLTTLLGNLMDDVQPYCRELLV